MDNFELRSVRRGITIGEVGKQPNRVHISRGAISGDSEEVGIDLVDCVNVFISDITFNGGSVAGSVAIRANGLTSTSGAVEDLWIERVLTEAWAFGIRVGGSGGTGMANWHISDCTFDGCFVAAFFIELQTPGSLQQVSVVNTHFAGITGSGSAVGIWIAAGGTPQRLQFANCRFRDFRHEAIRHGNTLAKDITFDGLQIFDCSSSGLNEANGILIESGVSKWAVRNSRICGANHYYAIKVTSNSTNFIIANNDTTTNSAGGVNIGSGCSVYNSSNNI